MADAKDIPAGGDAEAVRLGQDARREKNWKRWGPYLAERQWATVREDYSADGDCWGYFPHDHARSRAYRWGEDGLLGVTDRQCRLCFAVALWNTRDAILKERLFGVTGPEGNHGEDCKECYHYIDCTPTHSYMRAVYSYPHAEYPYERLAAESRARSRREGEVEITDLGLFDGGRYFDVTAEYAKADTDDLLIRLTVRNAGAEGATLHLLPTLWFRNTWSWAEDGGVASAGPVARPMLEARGERTIVALHPELGAMRLVAGPEVGAARMLFTENETNAERLFGYRNPGLYVKDAFHEHVVRGREGAVNPGLRGTKGCFHLVLRVGARSEETVRLRLSPLEGASDDPFGDFDAVCAARRREADEFYGARFPAAQTAEERVVARQAYAGLLWSKQFYHYVVGEWLAGDALQPAPPRERLHGRNSDWKHLYNRDVISMPDKWEYPWYAAWDLAFHAVALAQVDAEFAKQQLLLFLREWYMHPSGQLPAYEFALGDVNPPVHAWACWRVYKIAGPRGGRDVDFLARAFQKLLLNFTWWVNRKDLHGRHIFAGGFLGLDNIGVFDRSRPLPTGGHLDQADGTAWMAFYAATMLAMALELALHDAVYEDLASKFFEHFVAITDAMNCLGGSGLWHERDGFYYDRLLLDGESTPLKVRSLVGLIPLIAVEVLQQSTIDRLPGFRKRMDWFLRYRKDLARHISYMQRDDQPGHRDLRLLAIPSRERLVRVLGYMLDEKEFLSPFGVRSLSKHHAENPYVYRGPGGEEYRVDYEPGESATALFGGNSNWRGPVWFPVNFLLIEALERYAHFYRDAVTVEFPTGSGRRVNLQGVADALRGRLAALFLVGPPGDAVGGGLGDGLTRPATAGAAVYSRDPAWRERVLFHEYFHAETGRGLGASHQTGWTALIAPILFDLARARDAPCHEGEVGRHRRGTRGTRA